MVKVFSFSLFGSSPKYCRGLIKNIQLVNQYFPGWEVWVYRGDNVSEDYISEIISYPNVKIIPTHQEGMINKSYRFFPIDDPSVEICIVRDADSRIYERDRACIQEFIQSNKWFHIIRDHPNHFHKVMAGMWGIKQGILGVSIQVLFNDWKNKHFTNDFWDDTHFLTNTLYTMLWTNALIHDELQKFEPDFLKRPIPYPLGDAKHFIGQVYEYDENGNEYPKFSYNT